VIVLLDVINVVTIALVIVGVGVKRYRQLFFAAAGCIATFIGFLFVFPTLNVSSSKSDVMGVDFSSLDKANHFARMWLGIDAVRGTSLQCEFLMVSVIVGITAMFYGVFVGSRRETDSSRT